MKHRRTTSQIEHTAFHEAGHAVVSLLSGLPFRYVTLRPRDHLLVAGLVNTTGYRVVCEASARLSYAGPIAERRYLGRQSKLVGDAADHEHASAVVKIIAENLSGKELPEPSNVNYAALLDEDFEDTPEGFFAWEAQQNARLGKYKIPKRSQEPKLSRSLFASNRPRESARSMERRLRRETEALVTQHWGAITAVATALIARRTLSMAEVKLIMKESER